VSAVWDSPPFGLTEKITLNGATAVSAVRGVHFGFLSLSLTADTAVAPQTHG
jgi:hypothetical protein